LIRHRSFPYRPPLSERGRKRLPLTFMSLLDSVRNPNGTFKKGCRRPEVSLRNQIANPMKDNKVATLSGIKRRGKHNSPATEFIKGDARICGENNPLKRADLKERIRKAKLGAKNPSWKGGITPILEAERRKARYIAWRDAVKKIDNYTCQICGDKGQVVHHIFPFRKYSEVRYLINNGITLCSKCHKQQHKRGEKTGCSGQREASNILSKEGYKSLYGSARRELLGSIRVSENIPVNPGSLPMVEKPS
jgi:hypothetical protein